MIRFDVTNLVDVVRNTIDQATPSEDALRAATFAGAEVFRDEAKRNAQSHIQTGTIWRSIITKRLEEESDGGIRQVYKVTVRSGPREGRDAFYWRWVERGHKFVPRNPNVNPRTGKKFGWDAHRRAAELEYGNSRVQAYPFMRPAYDARKTAAVDAMTKKLREQLQRNAPNDDRSPSV